mmetsp:Transcript_22368/g.43499  ORF Transcript_22368/g.43499 Transcript_22368/m.43499 type:complete len:313 (-) Transcript_22368:436-1374(-)
MHAGVQRRRKHGNDARSGTIQVPREGCPGRSGHWGGGGEDPRGGHGRGAVRPLVQPGVRAVRLADLPRPLCVAVHPRPAARPLRAQREPAVAGGARAHRGGVAAAAQPLAAQRHLGQVPQGDQDPAARHEKGGGVAADELAGAPEHGAHAHHGRPGQRRDGVCELCLFWAAVCSSRVHRRGGLLEPVVSQPKEYHSGHRGTRRGARYVVWLWQHRLEGCGEEQDSDRVAGGGKHLLPCFQFPGAHAAPAHIGGDRGHTVPGAWVRVRLSDYAADLRCGDIPHDHPRGGRRHRPGVGTAGSGAFACCRGVSAA